MTIEKKRTGFVLLCAAILLFLAACGKRTDVSEGEDYIYCLNESKTGLAKVSCEIPDGTVEQQVEAVLEELARPAEDIEYVQVFTKEIGVNHFAVKNVIAEVDLSAPYLELPSVDEKLVRAAIVRSLLRIEGVQGVWLTVDGQPLHEESGEPVGVLNEDDFVENTGSSVSAYQTETLTLYFANETGDRLVEQKMNVRYSTNIPVEKIIVEKVMQGPKGKGSYPTLNPAATLLSVTVKEGICYVNFDSEFLNSAYNVKPEVAVYSLVNSLVKGTSAEKVQIAVNGVTDAKYMETVDLSQPLGSNPELVENTEDK